VARRTGHGTGRGSPRIEIMPFNELPAGVPGFNPPVDSPLAAELRRKIAAAEQALADAERGEGARVAKGVTSTLLGQLGGYTRALNHELGRLAQVNGEALAALARDLLPGLTSADPDFAAGLPMALEFITSESAALARDIGGGHLPNGPTSMLVSAALQLLASRVEFARGRWREASALANDSRQNLAACHEYAAKRAQSRPRDAMAELDRRMRLAEGKP